MNKINYTATIFVGLALLAASPGHAEISHHQSQRSEDQPANLFVNQLNNTTFESVNQFRCWQDGRLIVDEHNLQPLAASKVKLMQQESTTLSVYDFGETFCLYTGEK